MRSVFEPMNVELAPPQLLMLRAAADYATQGANALRQAEAQCAEGSPRCEDNIEAARVYLRRALQELGP